MRHLGLTLAALGAIALAAPSAGAATLPMALVAGTTYTFKFDGTVDGGSTQDGTGLFAELQLRYNGLTSGGTVADFDYKIWNKSTTQSRLSRFGFDTSPDVASGYATGLFDKILAGREYSFGNGNSTKVETCVVIDRDNCGGNGGLEVGGTTYAEGDLVLTLMSATTSFSLDGIFVRWQSVGANEQGSATGGVFNISTGTPMGGGGVGVPGPVAGAGLPVLIAAGGLLWSRRRKSIPTVPLG
jgi:hypothetical protein